MSWRPQRSFLEKTAALSNLNRPRVDTSAARRQATHPFSADPLNSSLIGWMRPTE
jgi:hypothetical protein